MPRAKRYLVEGYTYHLTHRCHDRAFLLRFTQDRDAYREWLRRGVCRYRIPVYAYCITSSHVHLIVHVKDRDAVGRFVNLVAGATARQYNRRKERSGAFWEDTYQCTAVEDGVHLWRCLRYVDLNMVRAGVVAHPAQWRWCGYDELTGNRTRYRILDLDGLIATLGKLDTKQLAESYAAAITEALEKESLRRIPAWSESVAVGTKSFVERVAATSGRRKLSYEAVEITADANMWRVREREDGYG